MAPVQLDPASKLYHDVAELSGLDKAQLSRLENGRHPNPTLFALGRCAAALGRRFNSTFQDA